MAAKKLPEAVPVAADAIEKTTEPRPVPPSPAAGGRYVQDPETGELIRVEHTTERTAQ